MLHISSVDEEELLCAFLTGTLGLAYESSYLAQRGGGFEGQESLVYLLSEDIYDTLSERGGRKVHCLLTVVIEHEGDLRIYEYDALECLVDIAHLRGV